jgi:rfaE bifunctional protein nucleotidyltransferase chain/domain
VEKVAARARRSSKRVVTTNGCFDILHVGHIRSLAYAKSLGDLLIVGVNSDVSARANKGVGRPIVPARERAEMLSALESVDYVFVFSTTTPIPWIEKIRPAVHVKGSDRSLNQVIEREAVEKHGGRVVLFPHTKKHSASAIVSKILRHYRRRKPESK